MFPLHPLFFLNFYYVPDTVPFTEGIFVHTSEMALASLQLPGGIFCELASILALVELVFNSLIFCTHVFFHSVLYVSLQDAINS